MLTKNEVSALNLSPTKKDFVQIWNELLEVASKLSERWDPTSTNESDPGIVLLKALTGIADKLNYNIDKNTLEAFMPTAAQEDSMRKLCEMLGYNVKYYRSAGTTITIKYHNQNPSEEEAKQMASESSGIAGAGGGVTIPKFTVITNADQDINYFTTNQFPVTISTDTPSVQFDCLEGQIVKCESSNDNNVITAAQISENNRFYLPETAIAENGIFIYNVFSANTGDGTFALSDTKAGVEESTPWTKVDNLNTQELDSRVYKFGFDSYEGRPYIEFPEDYSELFGNGIIIYYTRTNGASGNISSGTLTQLEVPTSSDWQQVSASSFGIEQLTAATMGADIETIGQAYNSFKKTIGTFDTLVTCRDYMNKIYSLVKPDGKPYVSNVLVTDIRNDLNRAITICSCDGSGIFYKESPLLIRKVISTSSRTDKEVSVPGTDGQLEDAGNGTYTTISEANKPYFSSISSTKTIDGVAVNTFWRMFNDNGFPLYPSEFITAGGASSNSFDPAKTGTVKAEDGVWIIEQESDTSTLIFKTNLPVEELEVIYPIKKYVVTINKVTEEKITEVPTIDHFDLVIYPFKSYNQIRTNVKSIRNVYDSSFSLGSFTAEGLEALLESSGSKLAAHTIRLPRAAGPITYTITNENGNQETAALGDIISINNYLRLSATIATNSKITIEEGTLLIEKIKVALANAFNMRELDFGEEIPFDSIVSVIENADSRIRVAAVNEPALYTTFSVYGGESGGNAVINEYAVASDWLTIEDAWASGRFEYDSETGSLRNFDTKEAKKIYNYLAARNVLAGRMPLFNYNTTFKSSFYESAYQVTEPVTDINELPDLLKSATLDESNPVMYVTDNDNIIYTGHWTSTEDPAGEVSYSKTYVPEEYLENIIDQVDNTDITNLSTSCTITANDDYRINDVTLAQGEFIKFRAPNFTTKKTYPAYVNYHLVLNENTIEAASPAEAETLFSILNEDVEDALVPGKEARWQKVLNHFTGKGKETFTLTQNISAFKSNDEADGICPSTGDSHLDNGNGVCASCGANLLSTIKKGDITVTVNNTNVNTKDITPADYLATSGCVKIKNGTVTGNENAYKYTVKPTLKWASSDGGPDLDFTLNFDLPFITYNTADFSVITAALDDKLAELQNMTLADGVTPVLPTADDWSISLSFECVPFTAATLSEWENFIKLKGKTTFWAPVVEQNKVFWRMYEGGYDVGKYILENRNKLLEFNSQYFGNLPQNRLLGVYIAKDLGKDAVSAILTNDEEYQLKANEYLYIEYTPSNVSEDGTSQAAEAVTEILKPGTIIRPSGFEVGLMDSDSFHALGNTAHKDITFDGVADPVPMYKLGVNEQIEVRELARVELSKEKFKASPMLYIYKNFDCPELEQGTGIRTYTLQDGEYIFYTDANKVELAYFGSGTEVRLEGATKIPKCEIIDIATIMDNGVQVVDWHWLSFAQASDKIIFQEYQYITLGPTDTLDDIKLLGNDKRLSSSWQYCEDVKYTAAGSENITLPTISVYELYDWDSCASSTNRGCGWQACSVLTLDVSNGSAQTLRCTDKVNTSIELKGINKSGSGLTDAITIEPKSKDYPIAIKANLACVTDTGTLALSDIYNKAASTTGFKFKVFAADSPVIVETAANKIIPATAQPNLALWSGEPLTTSSKHELWQSVALEKIRVANGDIKNDMALRLPVQLLPNTYGVFSIYLDYEGLASEEARTWIEVASTVSCPEGITLVNVAEDSINEYWVPGQSDDEPNKLFLQPGINCIRVGTSGKLFIKANNSAQGNLFFDDLQLVNTEHVLYDNKKTSTKTKGLNVKQLGYFSPDADVSGTSLTEDMRKEIKADYVDQLFSDLADKAKAVEKDFTKTYNALSSIKPQLQVINDLVVKIKEDIVNLYTTHPSNEDGTDNSYLITLFEKYHELCDALQAKNNLLTALNSNKDAEELHEQLAAIAKNLPVPEDARQTLIDELEKLKQKALDSGEKWSDTEIVNDFLAYNSNRIESITGNTPEIQKSDLLTQLKAASTLLVETDYNAQLTSIINNLNNFASNSERAQLLTIFNDLTSTKSATVRAELQSLTRQLTDTAAQTTLENLLNTALTAAVQPDYSLLDTTLNTISTLLAKQKRDQLTAELVTAISDENDAYTADLLENISKLDTSDTAIDKIQTMIFYLITSELPEGSRYSSVDQLGLVEQMAGICDLHDGEQLTEHTTITANVRYLYQAITDNYLSSFNKMIESIEDTLSDLDSSYKEEFASLQETTDEQVAVALKQFDDLKKLRRDALDKIDRAAKYDELPFAREAIVSVWSKHMSAALSDLVRSFYEITFERIINPAALVALEASAFTAHASYDSSALQKSTQFTAFQDLCRQAVINNKLLTRYESNKVLVNTIGQSVLDSATVQTQLEIFSESNDTANALIKDLCLSLQTNINSAEERYKLVKELRSALTSAIAEDTKLYEVLIKLISKNLFNYKQILADSDLSEEFYENAVSWFKNGIIAHLNFTPDSSNNICEQQLLFVEQLLDLYLGIDGDTGDTTDVGVLQALKGTRYAFASWLDQLVIEELSTNSILPTNAKQQIYDLVAAEEVLNTIGALTSADVFKNLSTLSADAVANDGVIREVLTMDSTNLKDMAAVQALLEDFKNNLITLSSTMTVDADYLEAYNLLQAEKQLLKDILAIDTDRSFYYTAPLDNTLAIEFNEADNRLNTLLNPRCNYDINNVNNNFVISKLDIEYLTSGLQLARSSRLN